MEIETIKVVASVAGSIFSHPFSMLIYGLILHFLQAMIQIRKGTGILITPKQYYYDNKLQSLFCFFSAIAAYFIIIPDPVPFGAENLAQTNAFTIGYMADAMAGIIGQRSSIAKPS